MDPADDNDQAILRAIRKLVKEGNRSSGQKKKVVLRGRRPLQKRLNPVTGRSVSYDFSGNIVGGLKNASEVDIYVYRVQG